MKTQKTEEIKIAKELLKKLDFFLTAVQEKLCAVSPDIFEKAFEASSSLRKSILLYQKDDLHQKNFQKVLEESVEVFGYIFSEESQCFLPLPSANVSQEKIQKYNNPLLFITS
ncbi:hypothetical protein IPN35_01910 [Candidatus Peregrinibacteria bacterium]|nr:MAG: hypothetical protein IPN35_01910 [Candidatus Peregrinibacteria bacterium]